MTEDNSSHKAPLKPFASRKPKNNSNTIEDEIKLTKIEEIYQQVTITTNERPIKPASKKLIEEPP